VYAQSRRNRRLRECRLLAERKAAGKPMEVTPKSKRLSQSLGGPVDFALLAEASHSPATLKQAPYLKNWRADFDAVLLLDPPAVLPSTPEGLTPVHAEPVAVLYRIQH
jgi:hypothetical protein